MENNAEGLGLRQRQTDVRAERRQIRLFERRTSPPPASVPAHSEWTAQRIRPQAALDEIIRRPSLHRLHVHRHARPGR